jgi:hypothetical protein
MTNNDLKIKINWNSSPRTITATVGGKSILGSIVIDIHAFYKALCALNSLPRNMRYEPLCSPLQGGTDLGNGLKTEYTLELLNATCGFQVSGGNIYSTNKPKLDF